MTDRYHCTRVTRRQALGSAVSGVAAFGLAGCLGVGRPGAAPSPIRFGIIADAQYADCPPGGRRHYRNSLGKLVACAADFNARDLAFVVHLGDLIDRDFASYDKALAACGRFNAPVRYVLGNHEFSVVPERKAEVRDLLGVGCGYYDFAHAGWRFIVLDGNDISVYAHAPGSEKRRAAEALRQKLSAAGRKNIAPYTGAMGQTQLAWLDRTLAATEKAGEKAVLFSHPPVWPKHGINLWNDQELLAILDAHPCVAAYINGHHHAGMYGVRNGVHYLTLRAMVETADRTSYAVVEATSAQMNILGIGRAESRVWPLGRPADDE